MPITFANGETYHCTLCSTIATEHMAFVAIDNVTFAEAASIFSDPDCTKLMKYGNYLLIDYTELMYIMQEPFGMKACLRGGYDEILPEE